MAAKYLTWEQESFSDKGISVFKELQIVDREKKNLLLNIININNSMNSLIVGNQNLNNEREKYEKIVDDVKGQKKILIKEFESINYEMNCFEQRVNIYEKGDFIQEMSNDDVEELENNLLKRLSQVKEEIARRKYKKIFGEIKEKVRAFVNISGFDEF